MRVSGVDHDEQRHSPAGAEQDKETRVAGTPAPAHAAMVRVPAARARTDSPTSCARDVTAERPKVTKSLSRRRIVAGHEWRWCMAPVSRGGFGLLLCPTQQRRPTTRRTDVVFTEHRFRSGLNP